VCAGYPLASSLLRGLSAWLDSCDPSVHWVPSARNRIIQVREKFGSLNDFEGILRRLEDYELQRVTATQPTISRQEPVDDPGAPAEGFYPQNLRSELISVFREFFYHNEKLRNEQPNAYDIFAVRKVGPDSTVITFNYDIALERALARAHKWDVGNGYGFPFLPNRIASEVTAYKLHGSVNWFKHPINDVPPPVIFTRDLRLLGYEDLSDLRVGGNGMAVDNSSTFILPDPRKEFYWKSFWEPLWDDAAERLRAANEVFVLGYSMPPADDRARRLLFHNIDKSAAIKIHCRSVGDRIAEEFRGLEFTDVRSFPSVDFEAWAAS